MKHIQFPKIAVVTLVALAVMTLGAGVAIASDIREKVEKDLMPTGVVSGATGEVRLELRSESGGTELRAEARAEGLHPNHTFSLWVGTMLIDLEESDDQGRVRLDDDMDVSFNPVTLSGKHVKIRSGSDMDGDVVLHTEIMGEDIQQ